MGASESTLSSPQSQVTLQFCSSVFVFAYIFSESPVKLNLLLTESIAPLETNRRYHHRLLQIRIRRSYIREYQIPQDCEFFFFFLFLSSEGIRIRQYLIKI